MTSALLVVVVDDDESMRIATESLVRSLGHAAASFGSAEEFLASALLLRADCLITDVRMPGMTGVELQFALQALGSRAPVIFITAYQEARVRDHVLAAGAVAYLGKPYSSAELVASLDAALGKEGGGASRH